MNNMKNIRYIIFILLILFIINTILVVTNNMVLFDNKIYDFIISFRCNYLDSFMKLITKAGNTITILIVVIILFLNLSKKNQRLLGICTISTVLINQLIKFIIRRDRPSHIRLIKQGGYSYPSGHAMISIAVYGFLIYYIYKKEKNKKKKILLITLLLFLIISIGISRVYVGVHYPSDVLGGYILSLSIQLIILLNINKMRGLLYGKNGSK